MGLLRSKGFPGSAINRSTIFLSADIPLIRFVRERAIDITKLLIEAQFFVLIACAYDGEGTSWVIVHRRHINGNNAHGRTFLAIAYTVIQHHLT